MEKINVTDTNISLPELLKRIEQGEAIKKILQTKSSPLQVLDALRKEERF